MEKIICYSLMLLANTPGLTMRKQAFNAAFEIFSEKFLQYEREIKGYLSLFLLSEEKDYLNEKKWNNIRKRKKNISF